MLSYSLKSIVKRIFKLVLRVLRYIPNKLVLNNRRRQTLRLIPVLKPLESRNSPRYIVSLTSYKKRLRKTAPYAIITLFDQSVKPDKVVLWVAHEDKEMIPDVLHKLTEKGLEIRFCEDVKSYTKLIPSLLEFPEDYIVTSDDDVYYPRNWFEQLKQMHEKNPKKIICHRAHGIKVDENHNPLPYSKWNAEIEPGVYFAHIPVSQKQSNPFRGRHKSVFPTGVSGVFYPPDCLYKEVSNKELFMKLAPYADDIWFWAMAVINKEYFGEESPHVVIPDGYSQNLSYIDPSVDSLLSYNFQGGNDRQFKAVIEYFPQIREVLGKIEPFQSAVYWEERYARGGNSGAGSFGLLAQFKAKVLNEFVAKHNINSVIEFGHGDGNQLMLAKYPRYLGFDVSETAVNICKNKFLDDKTKEFRLISAYNCEKAELTLSLDVIYHLIEDNIFEDHMKTLFEASKKYVIIYASNKNKLWAEHVKHRKFTDWIEKNSKNFKLLQFIPNKYPGDGNKPNTSFADFYVFKAGNS